MSDFHHIKIQVNYARQTDKILTVLSPLNSLYPCESQYRKREFNFPLELPLDVYYREWHYKEERRLVVINYSETLSTCRLKLELGGFPEDITFNDLLQGHTYQRSAEEILTQGLYIELKPYQSHIFDY